MTIWEHIHMNVNNTVWYYLCVWSIQRNKSCPFILNWYLRTDAARFYWNFHSNYFTDNCTNPPVCQNGGFVKQVDGVCSCDCVDGLTGTDCTQLNTSRGMSGFLNASLKGMRSIINRYILKDWMINYMPKYFISCKT